MQTINLNQNSFRLFPTIYMVQNDTGRELKMILDDVTLAGTETGAVAIKRSDGSYYTIPATLVTGENAFTADMTQALTQPSMTECQLKITDENDLVVSSYTFHIKVQPSTDGVSTEQLGVSVDELMAAAAQLAYASNDTKAALLQIAEKTAYIDANGQNYYDALYAALFPPVRATSVTLDKASLVFDTLNVTKTLTASVLPNDHEDHVVWGTSDPTVATVSDGIVTSVANGTAVITATCGPVHATAGVTVAGVTLVSISAVYTQGGIVYSADSLDSLKNDLVVTAHWSDSTDTTVASAYYSLSGSLTAGTSTITVTYGEETTTFTVTVTGGFLYTPASGKLSEQSYISFIGDGTVTESISNGELRMYGAKLSSGTKTSRYNFTPSTYSTSCYIKAEIKIVDVDYVATSNTTSTGYISFRASDGTNGASYGVARYGSKTAATKGRVLTSSNASWSSDISLNEWHTVEITCTATKQTIVIDNTTVVNDLDVKSQWVNTCCLFVYQAAHNNTDLYIKSIDFRAS